MRNEIRFAVLLLALTLTLQDPPAFAQQPANQPAKGLRALTGVLVDRACYNNAKASTASANKSVSAICSQECSKMTGMRVALVTGPGDVYTVEGDFTADNSHRTCATR